MATAQGQIEQPGIAKPRPWPPLLRVAFRFCFLYLAIFCLLTQTLTGLLPLANVEIQDLSTRPPVLQIVFWTAAHVFHISTPLVYTGSGSGDKTFDWVLAFCGLVFAAVATVVWSITDRHRRDYNSLHKWFQVFLRFAVGSEMLLYGMSKLVPLQMPFPFLTRLLEPFGNFSPMGANGPGRIA